VPHIVFNGDPDNLVKHSFRHLDMRRFWMYKHIIVSTPFRLSNGIRIAGAVAALVASLAVNLPARAQSDYPNRPVHLIVPYGPGGVADVNMRIVAGKLSDRLKQPFVVDNRPGAGSIVASKAVATAAPDGYTLLMTGNNTAIAAALFESLPYDILTEFASTSTTGFFDLLILTRVGSPLKSVQDILNAARANPGKLNLATTAPGSTQNLAAELLRSVAGINVAIVTFRTSGEMMTALLRGDVDFAFEFYAAASGLIGPKQVIAVASTGPKRSVYLPDVPTVQESGVKDYEALSWTGISVPAATPQSVVQVLTKAINDVLPSPDVQERARKLGLDMRGSTPEEMTVRMKNDIAKWTAVIEKAGIQKLH
jgi:tripartite-type tricarboxylate transporter receptor subunit TctC